MHGQTVSSQDRLYLTDRLPMMLVWGGRDPVLPVGHAHAAAESLPGCHLEVVPKAGHLPHRTDPVRFADAVTAFVAEHAVGAARRLALEGPAGAAHPVTRCGSAEEAAVLKVVLLLVVIAVVAVVVGRLRRGRGGGGG